MTASQLTTINLQRVHGRGLLLSTLEEDSILTGVKVFDNRRFKMETKCWDEYWQPVSKLCHGRNNVEENLSMLHTAWNKYIRSKLNISLGQNYCYSYFTVLDTLLSLRTEFNTQEWVHSLQTVLGFECFGIASATNDKVLAAGTCTLRNPCYLLAKLKMPFALDDPRLLAVITAPAIEQPELFFHYRQYSLSTDSPMSILLYPAVSIVKRLESFKLINSLVGGVSYGIDPRTVERARRIFQGIIRPLIEQKSNYKKAINLELADIGSGSGGLSAAICRKIYSLGVTPKLSLWFVDLEPADPARFFRNDKLRVFTDNLNFIGDDYRDWLT